MSRTQVDALVLGAGPAGLAAVPRLLEAGLTVAWVDQQPVPGGQIWRGGPANQDAQARDAAAQLAPWHEHPRLRRLLGHQCLGGTARPDGSLLLQFQASAPGAGLLELQTQRLLLATGARERALALPGWTLPGVSGAGGLQVLVKQGWPVTGQRVLLAGTGPLLLASAATLQAAGAQLVGIAESADAGKLWRFAARLPAAKLAQAASLRWALRQVPYTMGCWPLRILGERRVEAVELSDGRRQWTVPCDAVGLGFGLQPNTEAGQMLGCALDGPPGGERLRVDAQMRCSTAQVWAAGECTGVGGKDKAWLEGAMAALDMLDRPIPPSLRRRHQAQRRFAERLSSTFAWRPELLKLARPDTVVCRCEEVPLRELQPHASWREAKLQTRCGMGACQGRYCAPLAQALLDWPDAGPARGLRFPLQPVPLSALLDTAD